MALCFFILAFWPSKNFLPCGHSGPRCPAPVVSTLYCYFLLFLLSVNMVFRCCCLLLRFWFVIDQTLRKQQRVRFLPWYEPLETSLCLTIVWCKSVILNLPWCHKAREKREYLRRDARCYILKIILSP